MRPLDDHLTKLEARLQADRERLYERHDGFPPPLDLPPAICSQCDGAGAYLRRRGGDHGSQPGDLVTCSACQGSGRRNADTVMERRVETSGMKHKRDLSFDAPAPYPWQRELWNMGRDYAADPSGWLWMTGGFGTGKTHLSYCIGNVCLDAGTPVIFRAVPRLLDELRSGYEDDAEVSFHRIFDVLLTMRVLILDDYGKQSDTRWSLDKLFQLSDWRLERGLPTIITTNLTMEELEDQDLRLFRHVNDSPRVLFVPFPDKRPAS